MDDVKVCRISTIYQQGIHIDDDEETLEAVQGWMVEQLLAFKRVFGPHLAELVK